jgi:hypothetical protein
MWLNLFLAGCMCCPPPMPTAVSGRAVELSSRVTLTETQPVARIQLPTSIRAAPPPVLEIPLVKISNPQEMSFAIFVSVEWSRPAQGGAGKEKVLLGNFTVYPPDRTGNYMLRASTTFEKLKTLGADLSRDQIVVVLEMKRTNPSQPWSRVQVEIGPLRWRSDNS